MRFEVESYEGPIKKAWIDIGTKERADEEAKIRDFGVSLVKSQFLISNYRSTIWKTQTVSSIEMTKVSCTSL